MIAATAFDLREIPDVVSQLLADDRLSRSKQIAIEDALTTLNQLIKKKEREERKKQSQSKESRSGIDSTPSPSSEFLRRKRERKVQKRKHKPTTAPVDMFNQRGERSTLESSPESTRISNLNKIAIEPATAEGYMAENSPAFHIRTEMGRKLESLSHNTDVPGPDSHRDSYKVSPKPITTEANAPFSASSLEEEGLCTENARRVEGASNVSSKRFGIIFDSLTLRPTEWQLLNTTRTEDADPIRFLRSNCLPRKLFCETKTNVENRS